MPSLQTARRVANAKNNGAKTIGQIYKEQSDWVMEQTWDNDIHVETKGILKKRIRNFSTIMNFYPIT